MKMRLLLRVATGLSLMGIGLPLSKATPVPAEQADAFVASTGTNTHWRSANVYTNRYTDLRDKLVDSGLRLARDCGTNDDFIAKLHGLSNLGVKSITHVEPQLGIQAGSTYWGVAPNYLIDDYAALVGADTIRFVEMNNELDLHWSGIYWQNTGQPLDNTPASSYYWAKYLQASTPDASARVKGNPLTSSIPILGPSLTSAAAYNAVGDLSASIDFSTTHDYTGGYNPETTNANTSINTYITWAGVQGPGRGYVATEGGHHTASGITSGWPLFAQARYMPRYFLAHYVKGYDATVSYELVDEGTDTTNREQNFGLLKNDLTEKPAYAAVKNLLSLLKDPGSSFTPGSLDYTLSGATTDVWSLLLQKRNGDFYLCLWLGKPCFTPSTGATISVPAQSLTLALPAGIVSAKQFVLDDSGGLTSSALTISSNQVSLSVDDHVMVVRLSTAANAGAASAPTGLRVSTGNGNLKLQWSPTAEATSYTVKRGTASGSYTTLATGITTTSYTDSSVTLGTPYYYAVVAAAPGGDSPVSNEARARAGIVVDNSDGTGVTITGAWTASTSTSGYYATNALHDGNTGGTGGKSVRFTPTLSTAGYYDVFMRWPANTNRATNAPVDVVYSGGTQTLSVNQQVNSGNWVLLGTYYFAAGTSGNVLVRNTGANGYVMADAVEFMPSTSVIVDNADVSGVTVTGAWTASTATAGYYGTNYLHDGNTGGTGGKSVRFSPNLSVAGVYDVYLRWTSGANRASNAPVDVAHSGGSDTLSVNQQANNGAWSLLGTYYFSSGTSGNVLVRNDAANGYVVADAVQFVLR